MDLINSSVTEFTELLASKTSVPGGGGASALVASIGIALGDMVGEFTVGKKKYADVEQEEYFFLSSLLVFGSFHRLRYPSPMNK